jgi:hypothetical protein
LNQPVNHPQAGPPSREAHQYRPPAVGNAEASSAIDSPTMITKIDTIGQPIACCNGPP